MKKKPFIIIFLFINILIYAQNIDGNKLMESGLNNFLKGNYTLALGDFQEVILDNNYENLHGTAYYWIARSYMAQNLLDKSENNLDFFIQNFNGNKLYPDAVYQKGRLLFRKKEYQNAIQIFYKFIESYPANPYVSNSYFWIAESLYSLGHLEEAKSIYSMIIREYPKSFKLEASNYKLSLITLKFREIELLKLLKLSHEEYLNALEDFQRKEKIYEQSISEYQRRLNSSGTDDKKSTIADLSIKISNKDSDLDSLKKQIKQLNETIVNLKQQLADTDVEPKIVDSKIINNDAGAIKNARLLKAKNSALSLKEFYINWLASRIGE